MKNIEKIQADIENAANQVHTFLSFKLKNELFAANVSQVLTILELKPITKVPNSPDYMSGVINLRGNVLPVINMRLKFGMPVAEYTTETCIIVLNVKIDDEPVQLGILVDAVDEVIEITDDEIGESPTIGTKYKNEFIIGMYKLEQGFIMLLNIDLIFKTEDIVLSKETEQQANEEQVK